MRATSYVLIGSAIATTVAGVAQAGTISVTLPAMSVAEYKKPYVVGWLEPAAGGPPRSVFLWYAIKKGNAEAGTKWLADLRTWWRKSGRTMKLPADGISGATKAPGTHTIPLPTDLAPGAYILNVEAAREHGTRELVRVPLWIPASTGRTSGKVELGTVTISAK